jgi:hypothetical protein
VSNKQYIETDLSQTKYYSDKAMTVLHREDGPAVEDANGCKEWWIDGELHREDGPAIEGDYGYDYWYLNGKRHRLDGPAVECTEWWIDGESVNEEEFNLRMSPTIELTLDEIAKKFGVSVDKLKIKK